jgi:hypothetical protein
MRQRFAAMAKELDGRAPHEANRSA